MIECEITKIEGGFKIVSPDKTVELTFLLNHRTRFGGF